MMRGLFGFVIDTATFRSFGRIIGKGSVAVLLVSALLMFWLTEARGEIPGHASPVGKTATDSMGLSIEKPADLDTLIDAYRQAPAGEKARLKARIRSRIVDEVTGRQKTTIAEMIRLKKLEAEERRYAGRSKKSSKKIKKNPVKKDRTHRYSSRSCHSLECTFKRMKRSLQEFFRKATVKRRHPAKKPKAEEVLKGKVE